jgi:hypothetical protein
MTRCMAIAIVALLASQADARECLHAKPNGSHWASWRLIEGKRCWYVGHGRLAKSRLVWFHAPHETQAVRLIPLPVARPSDTFEQRWPR